MLKIINIINPAFIFVLTCLCEAKPNKNIPKIHLKSALLITAIITVRHAVYRAIYETSVKKEIRETKESTAIKYLDSIIFLLLCKNALILTPTNY